MRTTPGRWRRASRGDGAHSHGSGRTPEPPVIDPLETLAVQVRLAELGAEVRRIEADPDVFARAHHWRAAVLAYDALLRDACRLAGIEPGSVRLPVNAEAPCAQQVRLDEELELSERGWSW